MAASEAPRKNPWIQLVFGISILSIGLVLWLDRIGRIDGSEIKEWWPLLLIAMGLAHLAGRQWIGAGIWLAIGAHLLAPLFGFHQFNVWRLFGLWPLLIAFGGITLVRQALKKERRDFSALAVMGGTERSVRSDDFAGGDAVAVAGGCEIDLRNARIGSEAVIDVLAFWGGIELRVPRGWNVMMNVVPVLGGVTNGAAPAPAGSPRLIVRGTAIMGGVEVTQTVEETV